LPTAVKSVLSGCSGEINLANFDPEALMKVIPTAEHGGIKRKTKREQWRTKVEEGVSYSLAIAQGR